MKKWGLLLFILISTLITLTALFRPTAGEKAKGWRVAMITDSGDITDRSFNQQTFEACRDFCQKHNLSYTYLKPDGDNDSARIAAADTAVARGYNIIVMPGFVFAGALNKSTHRHPEVKFISLDLTEATICAAGVGQKYYENPSQYKASDYYNSQNTYVANYQEEIGGYLAGYYAVQSGYRKLGYLGGSAVPAVVRYGYGFLQGIDDAAAELGVSDKVSVQYAYAGQFYGSNEITAVMETWTRKGTEVVFAAGGSIWASAAEAASKGGGKIIGVDLDQKDMIDEYGAGMTLTSAMKRVDRTIDRALTAITDGTWEKDCAGKIERLGIVSPDPEKNFLSLSGTTQWDKGFTKEKYKQLVREIYEKKRVINSQIEQLPKTKVKVNVRAGTIM